MRYTYTPKDVPTLRGRMERMWHSPVGMHFGEIDLARSYGTDQNLAEYAAGHVMLLRTAEMYWISREMGALLRYAADSMPLATIEETDLPSPSGFMLFEDPMIGMDSDWPENDNLRIQAIQWGRVRVQGTWCVNMIFYDRTENFLRSNKLTRADFPELPELYFLGMSCWEIGTSADDFSGFYAAAPEGQRNSFLEDRRMIHAFFMLIRQRIADVSTRYPNRTEKRQAARSNYEHEPNVNVVTLRKTYGERVDPETARQVDWSHRWVVRGFWRNQWHPSEGRHVLRFIDAYVKGPPDKPLVIKETVNAWKR